MRTLDQQLSPFRARLRELVQQYPVPGLSLAVARHGEVFTAAVGIANMATGAPVTADTHFLIGSVTKTMTATLVMQLVDEGKVSLDEPITSYLKDFALADPAAADAITVRHLLNHSSGIDGDHFEDFGRDDVAPEKYVHSLVDIGLIHPTGQHWSYCNAGWVVLGRLIEVIEEEPFRMVLHGKLFDRAGIEDVVTLPEESMLRSSAVGHVPNPEGGFRVTPTYLLPHSMAATGTVVNMTARELVRFGQLHLRDGLADNGNRVLTEASARLMRQPTIARDYFTNDGAMGLGWWLAKRGEADVLLHGGGTTGITSFFENLPEYDLSIALLTNGPAGWTVGPPLFDELLAELADLPAVPKPTPADPVPDLDLSNYTGVYETRGLRVTVSAQDGVLTTESEYKKTDAEAEVPELTMAIPAMKLAAIDDTWFTAPGSSMPMPFGFIEPDVDGQRQYVSQGYRLIPRKA